MSLFFLKKRQIIECFFKKQYICTINSYKKQCFMKRLQFILPAIIVFFSFYGCDGSGVAVDPVKQQAKVDSIVSANAETIKDSVVQACDSRVQNDLAATADSIFKAMAEQSKK